MATSPDAKIDESYIARDAEGNIIAIPGANGEVEMMGGTAVKPGSIAKDAAKDSSIWPWIAALAALTVFFLGRTKDD